MGKKPVGANAIPVLLVLLTPPANSIPALLVLLTGRMAIRPVNKTRSAGIEFAGGVHCTSLNPHGLRKHKPFYVFVSIISNILQTSFV